MNSKELRDKFLKYFEKRGHKIVPSSSLIPKDNTVLLTTAGMQQFKSYYSGEESPYGKNTTSCQKSFRTSDIEEVGDESHLTFFEMLGNFSFGGYFKEEAIKFGKEFLDSVGIEIDYVTVFEGNENTPKDEESAKIWNKLGFTEEKGNLKYCNKEENFWGPTGEEGPCGPTTEIYAGGIEIWNIVFNEYYCKNEKLEKLEKPGIDTGMGLERLTLVSQNKKTVFETDLFELVIKKINLEDKKASRIIADHIRGSVFLIADGVTPSNTERGYILRRLLRRSIGLLKSEEILIDLAKIVIDKYKDVYPELENNNILDVIKTEQEKFEKTLERGISETISQVTETGQLTGDIAFKLYESFGIPLDVAKEITLEKDFKIEKNIDVYFEKAMKKHQELSRKGMEQKFKGGLADDSEQTTKYHTATHLLLAALREVLDKDVQQKGSNITAERLRFDFNHDAKLTNEEVEKVEDSVNQKIKEDLEVEFEEMPLDEAREKGAVGVFGEKYGDIVKVYTIGPSGASGEPFSKEICGGPHVERTSELGHFKIVKQKSPGAGMRRIRAILE